MIRWAIRCARLAIGAVLLFPALGSAQSDDPLLGGFRWRAIGPTGQGGRVNDLAVVERDPTTFYVGFATGGVWKTTNRGITFEPIFDRYGTHSIGDLAIAPSDPNVIYVGTGEANNRQSSSFGDGVYQSTDGGKTFTPRGLGETQSIARVVVHPMFRTLTGPGTAGLHRVQWDLCSDRRPLPPGQSGGGFGGGGACGTGGFGAGGGGGGSAPAGVARLAKPGIYRVTLTVGGKDYTRNITVLEDIWMD